MNFKGHLLGGIVAGVAVVGVAVQVGVVEFAVSTPSDLFQTGFGLQNGTLAAGGLFVLTLMMSLFPDLDTASVPQRWFFRFAFVLLVVLLLIKQMDIFAVVTLILLLPLLHRHRGWTHSRLTPVVISVFMVLALVYLRAPQMLRGLSINTIVSIGQQYWTVMLACIAGHYTHLLLDAR